MSQPLLLFAAQWECQVYDVEDDNQDNNLDNHRLGNKSQAVHISLVQGSRCKVQVFDHTDTEKRQQELFRHRSLFLQDFNGHVVAFPLLQRSGQLKCPSQH